MEAKEYIEALSKFKVDKNKTNYQKLENLKPFLMLLDSVEKSSIALFDMASLDYAFLTSNFKYLLGVNKKDKRELNMPYFFKKMNEEDRKIFYDTSIKSFSFLNSMNNEEKKNYRTCQDFRIQREDGKWIRLIQQMVSIELDYDGNIWLVLIVNDISPVHNQAVPSRRYMEHVITKERVLFPKEDSNVPSTLTKRETEILGLVSNGFPSNDIADFLGISCTTVNNHRQNILMKLGVTNSAEAVNYAKNIGIMN